MTPRELRLLWAIRVDPNRVLFGPLRARWEYFERMRVSSKTRVGKAAYGGYADRLMRAMSAESMDLPPAGG